MHSYHVPLLILGILITSGIIGAGLLFWHFCADSLDPETLKRANKGRRHGDQ